MSTVTQAPTSNEYAAKSFLWPWAIFVLLGMNMVIVAITVYAAATSSGSAVEKEYYEKALRWDDTARQASINRSLGWKVEMAAGPSRTLVLTLSDSRGMPIRSADVQTTVLHEADPASVRSVRFIGDGSGVYRAALPDGPPGLYRVRSSINAVHMIMTDERTVEVQAPGAR